MIGSHMMNLNNTKKSAKDIDMKNAELNTIINQKIIGNTQLQCALSKKKHSDTSDIQYKTNPYNYCENQLSSDVDEDDDIMFLSETDAHQENIKVLIPWKILIADDDTNVHDTTVLALNGVLIQGRPLEFMHAYSAQGAHQLVRSHPDTALILLDVVMESSDAGLKLVPLLRNELDRQNLRIIMRTGQPGYAKEHIMENYQIDGYASKSQLTRSILIKMLNEALHPTDKNKSEIH
jgi:CheY-like chemotaxis protein